MDSAMEDVVIHKFEKKINSNVIKAIGQVVADKIWVHVDGQTLCFENESTGSRRRGKSSAKDVKSNLIYAPMPGKITKLFKGLGDPVLVGESVLVMEAMKMEYTLKANMAGIIKKISFQENDQVNLGALIAEIEPGKES